MKLPVSPILAMPKALAAQAAGAFEFHFEGSTDGTLSQGCQADLAQAHSPCQTENIS